MTVLAAAVATFTINALATFLSLLMEGSYAATTIGYLGMLLILSVLFGRSVACFAVEFTTSLRLLLQCSLFTSSASMLYFTTSIPSGGLGHTTARGSAWLRVDDRAMMMASLMMASLMRDEGVAHRL